MFVLGLGLGLRLGQNLFRRHFDFLGDKSTHFGIFEGCGKSLPFSSGASGSSSGGGCC